MKMSEESGDIGSGIGQALEEAEKEIFGDPATAGGQGTPADLGGDDSSPGALEQIGEAIRPALEYMHDTADEPPERTGPYPAGGPH
jgi:hypothetical protein